MNKTICRILESKWGAALEIRILMYRTAKAFGAEAPKSAGLSAPELLAAYAAFTTQAAERAITRGEDPERLHRRLFAMAYRLGDDLRRLIKPRNAAECFAILLTLYRNIGITIKKEKGGKIRVEECYFSSFYTPEVCAVISAIDQGIFAGVCHGGRLLFHARITEGKDACMAEFKK